MQFFIVTPSFNQLEFLKRCVASVRDQVGSQSEQISDDRNQRSTYPSSDLRPLTSGSGSAIQVHHHVQDACSTDGTVEFLKEFQAEVGGLKFEARPDSQKNPPASNLTPQTALPGYTFSYASERDNGMYDAINRGWKLADDNVNIVAHLNCDEQYLVEALQMVADCFQQHENTDIVFASVIVTQPDGSYICSRRSVLPNRNHILTSHLPTFTAATFIKAQSIRKHNLYFDCSWKSCGDAEWALRWMESGLKATVLHAYTTAFVDSGENMSLGTNSQKERIALSLRAAPLTRRLKMLWIVQHRFRKLLTGGYARKPVEYSIYQNWDANPQRIQFHIDHACGIWKERV